MPGTSVSSHTGWPFVLFKREKPRQLGVVAVVFSHTRPIDFEGLKIIPKFCYKLMTQCDWGKYPNWNRDSNSSKLKSKCWLVVGPPLRKNDGFRQLRDDNRNPIFLGKCQEWQPFTTNQLGGGFPHLDGEIHHVLPRSTRKGASRRLQCDRRRRFDVGVRFAAGQNAEE